MPKAMPAIRDVAEAMANALPIAWGCSNKGIRTTSPGGRAARCSARETSWSHEPDVLGAIGFGYDQAIGSSPNHGQHIIQGNRGYQVR